MTAPKNTDKNGRFVKGNKGKPKGAINKTTRDIKESFQKLIENNLDNMTLWLQQVAADDPHKALSIIQNLSEYIVPKLARTEIKGDIKNNTITEINMIVPNETKSKSNI